LHNAQQDRPPLRIGPCWPGAAAGRPRRGAARGTGGAARRGAPRLQQGRGRGGGGRQAGRQAGIVW
jgi:hypothetical protein